MLYVAVMAHLKFQRCFSNHFEIHPLMQKTQDVPQLSPLFLMANYFETLGCRILQGQYGKREEYLGPKNFITVY